MSSLRNSHGGTALALASSYGRAEVERLLSEASERDGTCCMEKGFPYSVHGVSRHPKLRTFTSFVRPQTPLSLGGGGGGNYPENSACTRSLYTCMYVYIYIYSYI